MPTILVVDDEEAIRSLFRDILEAEGYQVTTAGNATQARERLSEGRFDVMLADLMLPEESGLNLVQFAADLDEEMSVVMVTGFPDLATAVEALKQGAYDYIAKPVKRQSLLATVERAYERKELVAEKRRLEQENAEYQVSLERKVDERTHSLRESEQRYRDLFQETRRAYEELQHAQERLIRSEKLAAVGELAAHVAHGIRNPLSAISNSVGVLRRDLALEGDDRRLLEVVYNESQRLAGMITDFLTYARPRPLQKSPQDLTKTLDDLLLLLSQDQKTGDRLNIVREYDEGLPLVGMDSVQIRDAVWNLLVNAVEAMPDGGTLSVRIGNASLANPPAVELAVQDTGQGIPPEEQHNVFQPFQTSKADGSGLGLAIVQRIVENHGGSIDLVSTSSKGSTFKLRLPIDTDE
jgi:signal transduction histidine kinase